MKQAAVALLLALAAAAGWAADAPWPARAITFVVPYPPGGSNDVFARQVARVLAEDLRQAVVVDNKPGASGNIGTAFVAKAAPDGYTLAAVSSSMTTTAAIAEAMPFDPLHGFAPVAMMARGPFIAAASNAFAARSPADLVRLLKAHPGRYNYGSSGIGSSNQFATELFKASSGTFLVHVPYRGMGPAVADLAADQVQVLFASGPSLLPQVRAGRIRALAVTSREPSPIAPDLPTIASVVPGYAFELWWGVLAPAGTPPPVVAGLNEAINRATASPALKRFLLSEGAEPVALDPQVFAATIAADIPRWRDLARRQGIRPE